MTPSQYHLNLIRLGLIAAEQSAASAEERAHYLEAAADLIPGSDLSVQCRVTAQCFREAENAQLRLFNSIRHSPPA